MLSGFCPACSFWSTVLQCGALLPIHTLNYWTVQSMPVSGAWFLTGGVYQCDIARRRSVAVLCKVCMLYKIWSTTMHPLNGALPGPYVPYWGLHAMLWLHIGILMRRLAAESRSIARHLFLSQCLSGTILLTLYSMVWDWLASRAG